MNEQNWKYSAYFKLYGKEGLQVSFTVHGDDAEMHVAQLSDYMTTLIDGEGFSITPEGIKPGEKLQEVDGWVLGETSEGQPCIHLFKSPLQWKVATIYEERMKDVPINIPHGTFVWPGAAPEREAAERRRVLAPCNFTIVLVPTGKMSENGKPIFKFDRTVGFGGASKKEPAKSGSKEAKKPSDVQSYADLYDLLQGDSKKLADWCRNAQKDPNNNLVSNAARINLLCEEINNLTGEVGSAEAVLEVITGVDATDLRRELETYVVNGLIKWIAPFVSEGKETVANKNRRPAVVEAVKYIWGMASGYNQVSQTAMTDNSTAHLPSGDVSFESPVVRDEDIPF